jgi:GlpG protein
MINKQGASGRQIPLLTAAACSVCVIIFLAVNVQGSANEAVLARWGSIPQRSIYGGAYWGLVTSAFVHIEPIHLLFNMYWLWILGAAFERTFGSLRWLLFLLCAAFVSSGLQLASGHDGIGMSGVVYAIFGFGWLGRTRYPEFARLVNAGVIRVFIGWGILCIVLTYLHVMNIGNFAHAGGLVFGAAVGGALTEEKDRAAFVAVIVMSSAVAVVPLVYNPLSVEWVADQAMSAERRGDDAKAISMYNRALQMGADEKWGWYNLAEIYGSRQDASEYKSAVQRLAEVDPAGAKEIEARYGKP